MIIPLKVNTKNEYMNELEIHIHQLFEGCVISAITGEIFIELEGIDENGDIAIRYINDGGYDMEDLNTIGFAVSDALEKKDVYDAIEEMFIQE